jgi:hypothetical protein
MEISWHDKEDQLVKSFCEVHSPGS